MSSDVDICNLALARLGDEANIVSISPPDQQTLNTQHREQYDYFI